MRHLVTITFEVDTTAQERSDRADGLEFDAEDYRRDIAQMARTLHGDARATMTGTGCGRVVNFRSSVVTKEAK